jgi:hypothetical protein
MKAFTIGVLSLVSLGSAQSTTPAAPRVDGRVSNSQIDLFTKDPEVQTRFWVDVMGTTAGKKGPDRDRYTLPKVLVIVGKGNPTVHFFTPDIDAMQKWYVANFGAILTSTWETRIELTERSEAAPCAKSLQPARQ